MRIVQATSLLYSQKQKFILSTIGNHWSYHAEEKLSPIYIKKKVTLQYEE